MTSPNNQPSCETIYHTPSGDIVIPDNSIVFENGVPCVQKPAWLVFDEVIINAKAITQIMKEDDCIQVYMCEESPTTIHPKDVNVAWAALQRAFSEGVTSRS